MPPAPRPTGTASPPTCPPGRGVCDGWWACTDTREVHSLRHGSLPVLCTLRVWTSVSLMVSQSIFTAPDPLCSAYSSVLSAPSGHWAPRCLRSSAFPRRRVAGTLQYLDLKDWRPSLSSTHLRFLLRVFLWPDGLSLFSTE